MKVSVEINNCAECPFVADDWGNCNHPASIAANGPYGRSLLKEEVGATIPGWCPAKADAEPAKVERLQARIDALMLEYCPDEMTPEQLANREKHQRAVPADAIRANKRTAASGATSQGSGSRACENYRAEILDAAAQCGDWDGATCEMNEADLLNFAALVADRYERALRHIAETGFASKDWRFAKFVLGGLPVEEARQKAEGA